MSVLNEYRDEIIALLLEGCTFRSIAQKYSVAVSTLHEFLNSKDVRDKYMSALADSAAMYAEKAELALLDAKSTKAELMRARELAQHYRWLASKRNPRNFGDKLDLTSAGEKISNPIDLSKLPTEILQQLLDAPLRPDSEAEHIEG